MRKALFIIAVLTVICRQGWSQTFAPGSAPAVRPVAAGQTASINLHHITTGADTWRNNFWSRDIRFIRGSWFMFGAEYPIPNGWKLIFTQLRSNATCDNYGNYANASDGAEECYFKIALESPKKEIQIDVQHIWADMRRQPIALYPAASGFPDILLSKVWYTFSREAMAYKYDDARNPPQQNIEDIPEEWSCPVPLSDDGTMVAGIAGQSAQPQNSRQFFFI